MTTSSALQPFLPGGPDSGRRRATFADRPRPIRPLPAVDGLLAGVAEIDITPPPGMPKAGYSANAFNGSGFRTRLRARIIHLRAGTTSLALVQCDLLGGSSVVHHLVATAIADCTDIPFAGLFLGATHTHAGPGQYLGTDFYNRFASNHSGFDPGFAQFLVERISDGIVAAHDSRVPARLAVGTTDVWGRTRNRSLPAHVRNASIDDPSMPKQRKFHAVNPELHLLRVDRIDEGDGDTTSPLGAMVVFSVHGTGIPMTVHEYNADIWAYLVGELGNRIEAAHGVRPVVGAVEGTHADVAPAIRPGAAGHLEAARVGRAIGAEAAALYERLAPELRAEVTLGAGLREVDLRTARDIDDITLPNRPAVGAALIGGAHENHTPVVNRIPPFGPGTPKRWGRPHPQGEKWVIGSRWFQPIVLRLDHFPRVLPVQVLRIDDSVIVGLPFEVTVESGRLIDQTVTKALDDAGAGSTLPSIDRVIVSSVANEYCGYVTTPDEYQLQHYEGAHTLYGPSTQPFLAAHAASVATDVLRTGVVQDVVAERSFDLKVVHHLIQPDPASAGAERHIVGAAAFTDPTKVTDGYWQLDWHDTAPGNLHWHEPLVRVESETADGWEPAVHDGRRIDDQSWDLQVTYEGAHGDHHHYSVRWWDPEFRGGRPYRFVLLANNGRPEVTSEPFA